MYFRRSKVTRGAIGAPSKLGLWLGPARVIMTEAVQQWSGSVHSTTGQIGVVWVSHGNKLIRCHPIQLRRCCERKISIASLKGLVQISIPTSVTGLTNALSPGQYEDLSTSLPTRDDLRFGEVDLEAPPIGQETMAPSFVPLFPSGTVVAPSQNTSARLSSIPNPVSASSCRESDVQIDESSSTPGSKQISPRELTRNQGEFARSSLENADTVTERRRIVEKRTIISPAPLALSDDVYSASVTESLNEAGFPQVFEPSESDTKKRRVESFDESVDWFQREVRMTNVPDEREIFEIDVGDPLESQRTFCRDSSVWLSKRLSDGKSSEVTYHRLLPGQQLQFDEAMAKELSQVLAADAVRRLSQEKEQKFKPERLLRMRWVLTWKYTEGGDEKAKTRLLVYQHPELTKIPTAAPTLGNMSRHLLLHACALHKLRVHFGDVSSAFLQTSASEEHQELTIKAPPEVGYLFSDSEGKPARCVRLIKSFYGLTSAPLAWWLDITQKLFQLGWKNMSTDRCLWCRYSDNGELKGVIGVHVDDFLIGLADGILGEKWMFEIKSLYRWGSWKISESEFAGIWVRQHREFSITIDLEDYTNKCITEAPITRERSRQRQESLTAQELSMLRSVLGTASCCGCELTVECDG